MNIILRPEMDNTFIGVFLLWRYANEKRLQDYFTKICQIPLEGYAEVVKFDLWVVIQYEIEQAMELQDHVYY